ncbi:MAG: glutamate--cysteine ligase [Betaproteobacteria bacterium]|nr:MAG: glutamate--cysteine ligase [Betaproteobacteria bacterium]
MENLVFGQSAPLTMGVELELQLVNTRDCDLTRGASDLLAVVERKPHPGEIKPEITESMLEMSTSIHTRHDELLVELRQIRDVVLAAADRLNIGVAGGGAHPFQHWSERQIFENPRFKRLSDLYGYLAKQFTIFGQHVHIGCPSGDEALYLMHAMSRYVPHFIALSAASPYYQGVDTAFDSSRLNSVFAFPLSGRAPFQRRWEEFQAYFNRMQGFGIVGSVKDFYWDIRPKPEYGTIEIRVCDTPVTVERAAALAAYAQALARYLLVERPHATGEEVYDVYSYNRFQACRFGLEAEYADPHTQQKSSLREDIVATLNALTVHARELDAEEGMENIADCVNVSGNDARWMRENYAKSRSLPDLVWRQADRWRGEGR